MMTDKTLQDLEYGKIIAMAAAHTHTPMAKDLFMQIKPAESYAEASALLKTTTECVSLLEEKSISPYFTFSNVSDVVSDATKGVQLSIKELYDVLQFCTLLERNAALFKQITQEDYPNVCALTDRVGQFEQLQHLLEKAIMNETELFDTASPELAEIRRKMASIHRRINTRLKGYLSDTSSNTFLQSNTISIRENRYVIPLKSECKGKIKGIIHDQSASGATLFIEPMEVFDLNNDYREQQLAESMEIARIIAALTKNVMIVAPYLMESFTALVRLDVCFAKAFFALKHKCTCPTFVKDGKLKLIKARHPLIDEKKVVPLNVELGDKFKLLLISGPNTGGKTVALKTVGLFTLLTMSGFYIHAAEGSTVSYFQQVFTDIGDAQSIENDLSTFSSHVVNLVSITDNLCPSSLVLLDEIGGGTEPGEGSAMAIAIIERLLKEDCRTILTTHYNSIKVYCYNSDGCQNASMDYNKDTMQPTYRLLIGTAGASNALDILKRFGMSEEIVNSARSQLSGENLNFEEATKRSEKINRELTEEKENVLKLKAETEQLRNILAEKNKKVDEKLEELNTRSKYIVQDMLRDYSSAADEIIEEMKELLKSNSEQNVIRANHLRKKLLDNSPEIEEDNSDKFVELDGKPTVGDDVFIKKLNNTGKVLAVRGGTLTISIGKLKTDVKATDAVRVQLHKIAQEKTKPQPVKVERELEIKSVPSEINLLGKTVDEGIQMVAKFLDSALEVGLYEVRIIHGKGTFALRNGIQAYLKTLRIVKSFRAGGFGEGDWGVTVVTLKK